MYTAFNYLILSSRFVFHFHCTIIILSPTEPYTPYNVTVYALNENGNGEMTTKTNFTVEGGQFVVLHVTII